MRDFKDNLTGNYASIQAAFWMDFCVALTFAAVYLQGLGYSNRVLGGIIAAGNLAGALLGTMLSSAIDGSERITAGTVYIPVLVIRMIMVVTLILSHAAGIVTTVSFILYIAFSMSINSLNLKLYVDAEHDGVFIDFGKARSAGSLAYVLLSVLLGVVTSRTSVHAVTAAAACIGVMQLAVYTMFRRKVAGLSKNHDAAPEEKPDEEPVTLAGFVRGNKRFCVLLAGTMLIFFSHNAVCNFLINVSVNVGGGAGFMGLLNGFMAAVEIPVIFSFSRFSGKRSAASLLRFAFIAFTFKAAAIAAASSMAGLAAAMLLQAPSFAVYTASIVRYVEKTVRLEDSAKAQSLAFSMTTLGSVLASAVCGTLYDTLGVTATLWFAAALCAAGSLTAIAGLDSKAGYGC